MAPGESCMLPISFSPQKAGALTGSLNFTDTNLNAIAPAYARQSISLSGTATQLTQTISFSVPVNAPIGAMLQLTATASSGLPVSLSILSPGQCVLSGNKVWLQKQGNCVIQATQKGNVEYTAATPVNGTIRALVR